MQKNVLCKNCEQPSESDQMFDIKYRVVVDAYKSWF